RRTAAHSKTSSTKSSGRSSTSSSWANPRSPTSLSSSTTADSMMWSRSSRAGTWPRPGVRLATVWRSRTISAPHTSAVTSSRCPGSKPSPIAPSPARPRSTAAGGSEHSRTLSTAEPSVQRSSEETLAEARTALHRREPPPRLQLLDRGRQLEGAEVIKGVPDDLHAGGAPAVGEPRGHVDDRHPIADVDRHRHMRLPVVVEAQPSDIAVRTVPADSACVDGDPVEVAGVGLQSRHRRGGSQQDVEPPHCGRELGLDLRPHGEPVIE